jgi:phosphoribosylaminoimidazole-succinocarboxamide synthase
MTTAPLLQSHVHGFTCRRGKVRDVYDLGDTLAIVATDRISAFDWVMPTGIPDKGRILTAMSVFWFDWLQVPHHHLGTDLQRLPAAFQNEQLRGRTMHVRKTEVVPVECVARGYLAGSGWKEYRSSGAVCGILLPAELQEAGKLPNVIFTPATKEEGGKHDENISFERMAELVGAATSKELRDRTIDVYRRASEHAERRGIILADTKLEWGRLPSGELILIDEVLTPDSSRFWPKETYRPGSSPPSFDKQFLRDWLETTGWDKKSPPPELPMEVVESTAARYREAFELLTGSENR